MSTFLFPTINFSPESHLKVTFLSHPKTIYLIENNVARYISIC